MADRTYIALNGPSEWATFNAMWAVLKQHDYVPDSIIIATFKEDARRASRTSDRLKVLLEAYDKAIEPRIIEVDDSSVDSVCEAFKSLFTAEKEAGNAVSMDVTNGRKMMALCALKAWDVKKLEHLFYLYLGSLKDADHPYMCIPLSEQRLCDLREG
jgi:hypothetical protein